MSLSCRRRLRPLWPSSMEGDLLCEILSLERSFTLDWVGFLRLSNFPQCAISTSSYGRSFLSTFSFAILCSTCCPDTTCPKTVCFVFRCSQGAKVMKNLRRPPHKFLPLDVQSCA